MALEAVGSNPITHPKAKKHPVRVLFCFLGGVVLRRTHKEALGNDIAPLPSL